MRVSVAFAAMGVAIVATSGAAHAQSLAERTATAAEVPWYERFTYSSSGSNAIPSWSSVNPRDPNASAPSARWGMTVNVGERDRVSTGGAIAPAGTEAAIGAYYRFSPRVRVGGQVSVAPQTVTPGSSRPVEEEADAGVKLQSAFRF